MAEDRKQSSEFRDKDEPVSLAPLSPEDTLRALLAVKQTDDDAREGQSRKGEKPS